MRRVLLCLVLSAAFLLPAGQVLAGEAAEPVSVIIRMAERPSLPVPGPANRKTARKNLVSSLRGQAERSQKDLLAFLSANGATDIRSLWIINAVAATVPPDLIPVLSARPDVESVEPDATVTQPPPPPAPASEEPRTKQAAPLTWNIAEVDPAPVWNLGFQGQGVVVATMDSGVDPDHPELMPRWRGGANSWFDTHGVYPTPHDSSGHGTQVMGIILAGNASGQSVGMAPQARWIAVRIFNNQGQSTWAGIHLGFQWLLDPDGNPATDDAPDVVNNSWGLSEYAGECRDEFTADVLALKAAGMAVVFAAGNSGPAPGSSLSPANGQGGFGVGAVDRTLAVAFFSSRGPSPCPGHGPYPNLTAPGVSVPTTDLTLGGVDTGYGEATGTSFAAGHAAGAMALLLSAFPGLPPDRLEAALDGSARDLGPAGPDDDYGNGLLDASAAYNALVQEGEIPCVPPGVEIFQAEGAVVGQPVDFTAMVSGGAPPFTYDWNLDSVPGTDCADATCTRVYNDFFTGEITLCVTDSGGCSRCVSQSVVAGVEVDGVVRTPGGGPAPGLAVSLDTRPWIQAVSGAPDGAFALGGVPVGQGASLLVREDPPAGLFAPSLSASFTPGVAGATLDPVAVPAALAASLAASCAPVNNEGILVGSMTGPGGTAVSGARVKVSDSAGQAALVLYLNADGSEIPGATATGADGLFAACGLDPAAGPVTVSATKSGWTFSAVAAPVVSNAPDGTVTALSVAGTQGAAPPPASSGGGGSGGCFLETAGK